MTAGRRAILLAGLTVIAAVLMIGTALWPVLEPLTLRTSLPAASRSVDGVPVPESARRCAAQDPTTPTSVRWCMPSGVSAATVARWYADVLPAGQDAGRLTWCVEQHQSDGGRRALWSTGTSLVGYVLPADRERPEIERIDDEVAVEVVRLDGSPCPPAARASREQP